MTKLYRFYASEMPMALTPGRVKPEYWHAEKMRKWGGYKAECVKCEHECKQWNCPTLIIKYCPRMEEE